MPSNATGDTDPKASCLLATHAPCSSSLLLSNRGGHSPPSWARLTNRDLLREGQRDEQQRQPHGNACNHLVHGQLQSQPLELRLGGLLQQEIREHVLRGQVGDGHGCGAPGSARQDLVLPASGELRGSFTLSLAGCAAFAFPLPAPQMLPHPACLYVSVPPAPSDPAGLSRSLPPPPAGRGGAGIRALRFLRSHLAPSAGVSPRDARGTRIRASPARPQAREPRARQSASLWPCAYASPRLPKGPPGLPCALSQPRRPLPEPSGETEYPGAWSFRRRGDAGRGGRGCIPRPSGPLSDKGIFPLSGTFENSPVPPGRILLTSWHPGILKSFLQATLSVDGMAPFMPHP
ncbi:PREDICTED: uncharacterized protein LOC105594154 [Cercocebus atys]|uniref:uncharacterized protein LOC105594154 n=1 Tax=Cercocebus atys TaxID=9531 RepID=UPI0005F4191B|nr:PREDICTED: uncharacterized protein LOC105594154 [Cercocebus atys]